MMASIANNPTLTTLVIGASNRFQYAIDSILSNRKQVFFSNSYNFSFKHSSEILIPRSALLLYIAKSRGRDDETDCNGGVDDD